MPLLHSIYLGDLETYYLNTRRFQKSNYTVSRVRLMVFLSFSPRQQTLCRVRWKTYSCTWSLLCITSTDFRLKWEVLRHYLEMKKVRWSTGFFRQVWVKHKIVASLSLFLILQRLDDTHPPGLKENREEDILKTSLRTEIRRIPRCRSQLGSVNANTWTKDHATSNYVWVIAIVGLHAEWYLEPQGSQSFDIIVKDVRNMNAIDSIREIRFPLDWGISIDFTEKRHRTTETL